MTARTSLSCPWALDVYRWLRDIWNDRTNPRKLVLRRKRRDCPSIVLECVLRCPWSPYTGHPLIHLYKQFLALINSLSLKPLWASDISTKTGLENVIKIQGKITNMRRRVHCSRAAARLNVNKHCLKTLGVLKNEKTNNKSDTSALMRSLTG